MPLICDASTVLPPIIPVHVTVVGILSLEGSSLLSWLYCFSPWALSHVSLRTEASMVATNRHKCQAMLLPLYQHHHLFFCPNTLHLSGYNFG
jgi:hypothetical protein